MYGAVMRWDREEGGKDLVEVEMGMKDTAAAAVGASSWESQVNMT